MKKALFSLLFFTSCTYLANGTQINSNQDFLSKVELQVEEAEKILANSHTLRAEFIFDHLYTLDLEVENLESEVNALKDFYNKIANLSEEELSAQHDALEEDSDYLFKEINTSNDKLKFTLKVYKEINEENERLSFEYHGKWNNLFQYRKRIENLFVEEETINMYYGSVTELKKLKIRKRNLYEAAIFVYDSKLFDLKNLSQCDYIPRIKTIEETKALLVRMEELLFEENTRPLEKSLKNDRDEKSILNKINRYPTASSSK